MPLKRKPQVSTITSSSSSNGDLIDTLELAFRRDENILRFLTIALDRYGVEYNEKKRNKQSAAPEVVSEEQEN